MKKKKYYALLGAITLVVCGGLTGVTAYLSSQPVTSLEKPAVGEESTSEELVIKGKEGETSYVVEVPARVRSENEIGKLLSSAEKEIRKNLKGENKDLAHVTKPLTLATEAADGAVTVSWNTDQPDILSYDGTLGEEIPKEGVTVTLQAELSCGDQVREFSENVSVFPKTRDGFLAELEEALTASNENDADGTYHLPSATSSGAISWYRDISNPAPFAAMLILFAGVAWPLRNAEKKKNEAEAYRAALQLQYPLLVSQTMLYMGAGMSIREVFKRLAAPNRQGFRGPLYEECVHFCRDTAQGYSDGEALMRLGERSGLFEYRTFCSMLLTNIKKGNRYVLPMLKSEADKAFAERERHARILGNEAGTKLLMPMMLMLLVVLILVLFPAMTSFYE